MSLQVIRRNTRAVVLDGQLIDATKAIGFHRASDRVSIGVDGVPDDLCQRGLGRQGEGLKVSLLHADVKVLHVESVWHARLTSVPKHQVEDGHRSCRSLAVSARTMQA